MSTNEPIKVEPKKAEAPTETPKIVEKKKRAKKKGYEKPEIQSDKYIKKQRIYRNLKEAMGYDPEKHKLSNTAKSTVYETLQTIIKALIENTGSVRGSASDNANKISKTTKPRHIETAWAIMKRSMGAN